MVHQLKNVLRVRKGDNIAFFNDREEDRGFDMVAEIKTIDVSSIACLMRERVENTKEPTKKLTLYMALVKKDKFEWIVQKGTEVGVSEFVPVLAAHSEKKSFKQDRVAGIIREAAEQSGRAILPTIHVALSFDEALRDAVTSGYKTFFAHTKDHATMIRGAGDRAVNLFVGPEGGWDEKEVRAADHANCESVSLGRLTLRAETAAIAGSYILLWM